ncbi:hypothetical protein IWZ01DRAFT_481517 [Phyllosticta capitalensis]
MDSATQSASSPPPKRGHRRHRSSGDLFVSSLTLSAAPDPANAANKPPPKSTASITRPAKTRSKNVLDAFEHIIKAGVDNIMDSDMRPRARLGGPQQPRERCLIDTGARILKPHEWSNETIRTIERIITICKDMPRVKKLLRSHMLDRQRDERLRNKTKTTPGLLMLDFNAVLHYLRSQTSWDGRLTKEEDAPNSTQDDEDRPEVKAAESSVQAPDGFSATPYASTIDTSKLQVEVMEDLRSKLISDLGRLKNLRCGIQDISATTKPELELREAKKQASENFREFRPVGGETDLKKLQLSYSRHETLRMEEEQARLVHEYVLIADRAVILYTSFGRDWEIVLPDDLQQVIDWLQPYLSKAMKAPQPKQRKKRKIFKETSSEGDLSRIPKPAPLLGSFKPQGQKRKVFEESSDDDETSYTRHNALQKEEEKARLAHEYVLIAGRAAALYRSVCNYSEIFLPAGLEQAIDWLQPHLLKPTKALQLGKSKPQQRNKKRKIFEESSDGEDHNWYLVQFEFAQPARVECFSWETRSVKPMTIP